MKHRRCVRDHERLPEHHKTYLYWSMIHVMAARIARRRPPVRAGGAANARTERLARGEREPLDDWPDGPPEGDSEAMKHYLAAFRDWHQKHVGPVTDAEFQRVRADHGLA